MGNKALNRSPIKLASDITAVSIFRIEFPTPKMIASPYAESSILRYRSRRCHNPNLRNLYYAMTTSKLVMYCVLYMPFMPYTDVVCGLNPVFESWMEVKVNSYSAPDW
jgi:hypothetical protein